ncbi:related to thiol methyltransferase [Ramularia collo-cygni]|uniref:Related to thiol methyltransferase n=1 Tax=Ramularia collo-cygni TaxID=112498 RepID=A0A2D3VAQ8_9PEZI|nr:related to thiol methyltransferase [Ramularia collo-cygni]CZT17533.1 related to thiol methyltransferase [Ramularia collo-cygni]
MSSDQKTDIGVLRQQFLNQPPETHTKHWEDLWQKQTTPWDRNGPSLALKDTVTGRQDLFGSALKDVASNQRKRALVPGCGRGYDVLLLASLGYDCYGLDASQTAIDAALKHQAESSKDEQYVPHDSKVGAGETKFLVHNFFKDDFLADTNGGNFDLIFDYTFLCALPPEMRPSWAKRMSELLSPTGYLICLEWPLHKAPTEGGPPHGLSSELYVQLFHNPGQDVKYNSNGFVTQDLSAEKGELALVRVAHDMPSRTHEAGQGKDYVGIWRHAKL